MLIRPRIIFPLALVVAVAALSGALVSGALGGYTAQSANTGNMFTTAAAFDGTGYHSPTANAADTGGDGNGFEANPTYAYADDANYASNTDGPGDRHRYYDYGFSIPPGSTIDGIRVRADWWMGGVGGSNSLGVDLSWDGGVTWTSMKTDTVETNNEHTAILGGAADTWGRVWTAEEFSDANFVVRVTCNCSGGTECDSRDFFLDWLAVNVYYTAP